MELPDAIAVQCDVKDDEQCRELIAEAFLTMARLMFSSTMREFPTL